MTETPLIIIELSPRQDIGYTVKAGEMENRIIEKHRDDIIDTLLLLAEQLKAKRSHAARRNAMTVNEAKSLQAEHDAQLCEWLPYSTGLAGKTYAEAIRGVGMGGRLAIGFQPSSEIKFSSLIPRATVAAALRELRARIAAERSALFAPVLAEIDATIAALGLGDQGEERKCS